MIRRTFIEILSGLLVHRPEWPAGDRPVAHPPAPNLRSRNPIPVHSPSTASPSVASPSTHSLSANSPSIPSPSAHRPAIESRFASWVNETDPEWLTEWMRQPRLNLLPGDLPLIPDPDQRELAAQILRQMQSGTPATGSSTPRPTSSGNNCRAAAAPALCSLFDRPLLHFSPAVYNGPRFSAISR